MVCEDYQWSFIDDVELLEGDHTYQFSSGKLLLHYASFSLWHTGFGGGLRRLSGGVGVFFETLLLLAGDDLCLFIGYDSILGLEVEFLQELSNVSRCLGLSYNGRGQKKSDTYTSELIRLSG